MTTMRWSLRQVWMGACMACGMVVIGQGQAGVLAQYRTVYGDVQVELFEREKPVTVSNFVSYVESGAWKDMFAHRLVPGFVIQGGGYRVAGRGTTNAMVERVPRGPNIPNEFAVGPRLSNVFGTIAMAKVGGDTNSANAEWYINLANNTYLDAADSNNLFTVFGRVVGGTNVLGVFNRFVYYTGPKTRATNVVVNAGAPFNELPLVRTNGGLDYLVYVDVTLLRVEVKAEEAGTAVAWNSVAGRTNRVEFTRSVPPSWEVLSRSQGTGGRMTVVDPASTNEFRFYRVRVEY